MEMWSHVAVYIPFVDRLRTFRSLRCAGLIPDTNTNPSNAFLQFCSEADRIEREEMRDDESCTRIATEESVRVLLGMGFNDDEVRLALRLTHGSLYGAVEQLLVA